MVRLNKVKILSILLLTVIFIITYQQKSATQTLKNSLDNIEILLTFDDGPNPDYTPEILNILDKYNIKANFFVVGSEIEKHPQILKDMFERGHAISNHTYSHRAINRMNSAQLKDEISRTDAQIQAITGQTTKYARPPFGAYQQENAATLKELNKKVLLWDLCIEKKKFDQAEDLVANLLTRMAISKPKKQYILLLHDGDPQKKHDRHLTVEALPLLIEQLEQRGCTFIDPTSNSGSQFMDKYCEEHPKIKSY